MAQADFGGVGWNGAACQVTGIHRQPPLLLLLLLLLEYSHRDLILRSHHIVSNITADVRVAWRFNVYNASLAAAQTRFHPVWIKASAHPRCRPAAWLAIPARLTKRASCSTYIRFVDMRSAGPVSFLPSLPESQSAEAVLLQCCDGLTLMMMCYYYPAGVCLWIVTTMMI